MLLKKIIHCARCGEDHINIEAKKFTQPVLEDAPSEKALYTHWALCPTNGEPILVVEVTTDGKMQIDTHPKEGA